MMMAVVEMRNQLLFGTRGHISRGIRFLGEIGGDSSNWNCTYYCMGH